MYSIDISSTIQAPIHQVFSTISNHEQFFRGSTFEYSRIIREGQFHRNGVGAIREISRDGIVCCEEITLYEEPRRFDYVITRATGKNGKSIPIKHEFGRMEFEERQGKTYIRWQSKFSIPTPIVGRILEFIIGRSTTKVFKNLLAQAENDISKIST